MVYIIGAIIGALAVIGGAVLSKVLDTITIKRKLFLEKKFEFYEKTYCFLGSITSCAGEMNNEKAQQIRNAMTSYYPDYHAKSLYLSGTMVENIENLIKYYNSDFADVIKKSNGKKATVEFKNFAPALEKCREQIKKEMNSW